MALPVCLCARPAPAPLPRCHHLTPRALGSGFSVLFTSKDTEKTLNTVEKKTASPPGLRNYLFCYNQYFRLHPSRMEASKTGLRKATASETSDTHANRQE